MNISEALAAPRISFTEPDWPAVEERIPQDVQDGLLALGAADPRGPGLALGY
jgi:hypothetical protein